MNLPLYLKEIKLQLKKGSVPNDVILAALNEVRRETIEEIAASMSSPCLRYKEACGECLNCEFTKKAIRIRALKETKIV